MLVIQYRKIGTHTCRITRWEVGDPGLVSKWSLRPGPGFFVCFLPVSMPELSWDQLSWAQVYRFRLFVFVWAELTVSKLTKLQVIVSKLGRCLTSPWAGLSKAELCNNGPYLDARTDRMSPHNPPTPSRIPKKILFQGFLRVETRSPLTNLPWYADRLLRVIIVCFVT